MQTLTKVVETNEWTDPRTQEFKKVKDDLSICNGIVLRGSNIVLPSSVRNAAIELAHVGHQGIVKTKSLIREKIWFPGIDRLVEIK